MSLLDWVLKLLDDEVEVVPPVVGEEAGVEGERDLGVVLGGAVPGEVLNLACTYQSKYCTGLTRGRGLSGDNDVTKSSSIRRSENRSGKVTLPYKKG